MDTDALLALAKLLQAGGSGALLVALWFVADALREAKRAVATLGEIRDELKRQAEVERIAHESTDRKLDEVRDELARLPLSVIRARRQVEG